VLRAQWNIFLIAVMFLTRLPVGRWVRYEQSLLAHCTVYFPLVGAGVGAFGAGVLWLGAMLVPLPLAVLLSMLSTVLLTGAFHEDGLADSADGFGGASDAARVLEIMRDSRIGTYGAIALWFLLTTKGIL
jgi:cobalamin-5'-phosphate synthase (EC 2.7.8.26)